MNTVILVKYLDLELKKFVCQYINKFDVEQLEHREIVIGQHCFACTAGAGSSCQGATI